MDIPLREPIDRVPGQPLTTAWRVAARRHQHLWREALALPAGTQLVRPKPDDPAGPRRRRPIGSRVDETYARAHGSNFLTEAARKAAEHRLHPDNREKHETLDAGRLYCDLLSSMPMCFNLFGPLWADPILAASVAGRWFPDLCEAGTRVEVRFEWSPGRRDPRWLGDRTAFDAALFLRHETGTTVVGVETKYHERAPATRTKEIRAEYRRVAEHAGMFNEPRTIDEVQGTPAEQVWRDHLLALACRQVPPPGIDRIADVRYVLVAPSGNPAWADVCRNYEALLARQVHPTFEYRTLDALIDEVADLLPHTADFRARYLDVEVEPRA